jgi:hypothetical protein
MSEGPIAFLITLFSLLAGLPLLALGLCWTWRRLALRREGLQAVVEVVGYESHKDFDNSLVWYNAVVTLAGQRHVLTTGETRQRWAVGTRLPVRYRPGEAERMVVDRADTLFFMPVTIALMGAGLIGFSFI